MAPDLRPSGEAVQTKCVGLGLEAFHVTGVETGTGTGAGTGQRPDDLILNQEVASRARQPP